jgi:hypothetical protein
LIPAPAVKKSKKSKVASKTKTKSESAMLASDYDEAARYELQRFATWAAVQALLPGPAS